VAKIRRRRTRNKSRNFSSDESMSLRNETSSHDAMASSSSAQGVSANWYAIFSVGAISRWPQLASDLSAICSQSEARALRPNT
jgi:hypothetical protein